MNIKDVAFSFYRKIWNSPHRHEVRNVAAKLKSSSRGYGEKLYPSPILGLLLYNQQALKEFAGKTPCEELVDWTERERKILFGAHKQVLRFNRECLAPLAAELPDSLVPVNPYKNYPNPDPSD